jgi:putative Ca2+/H+ antiporter (TMEM165/GDT1 family)
MDIKEILKKKVSMRLLVFTGVYQVVILLFVLSIIIQSYLSEIPLPIVAWVCIVALIIITVWGLYETTKEINKERKARG